MRKAPAIPEIKKWLQKHNPLGLFSGAEFSIKDIDPKPWSGHFNFLITIGNQNFVLRFKGPEWGEPAAGIIDEYEILKAAEKYQVGPKARYLAKDFFGEPMMLEEYLIGRTLNAVPEKEQAEIFSSAAKFIAKINKMKFPREILSKQEQIFSYKRHKENWQERLKIILADSNTRAWGERVKELLPGAEKMLDGFEERLIRVIKRSGPVFIFKSAHAGHCVETGDGFRFFNWEKNGFGDPSFSLAVFLASVQKHPNFRHIKEIMIKSYLEEKNIPEFSELVGQRLKEREVSNLLWVLWAYANRKDAGPVEQTTGVQKRFERVKNFLAQA